MRKLFLRLVKGTSPFYLYIGLTLFNIDIPDDPVRFLGVYLDRTLCWNRHIAATCSKLSSSIFGLRVLSYSLSPQMLRTAYCTLYQPIMTYGLLIWGGAAAWHEIFGLQRKAIRIVDKLQYREDCRCSFVRLRVLTFPSLYILECVLYVRQNLHRFTSHEEVHDHHTRFKDQLKPDFYRLSRCQRSTNCMSIKFYNKLPQSVCRLPLTKFRSVVKNYLIEKAFYSYGEFLDSHIDPGSFEDFV